MISPYQFDQLSKTLPFLQRAEPALVSEFQRTAYSARIPAGKDIFAQGDQVDAIALLLSGAVRVYKIGETGREITLYRFGVGESCILTANAILNHHAFAAVATVEQDAEAIMIPATAFRDWVRRYDPWREFVFDLLSRRLASVIEIVDEVAFRRLDIRVASLLLERSKTANPVSITHQEIAAELGSSREVVSRILETLTGQNMVQMERGTIHVIDAQSLETLAAR